MHTPKTIALYFLLTAFSLLLAEVSANPTVSITPGTLTGVTCPSSAVNAYRGIPFAQPPTGNLRFASPVAFQGSFPNGALNASAFAPVCIQFGSSMIAPGPSSEDCLYLNVWTPANATASSKLPVKVFIHGGSFTAGGTADPLYDGCNLATDAIIVTLAYRLGPLGFLGLASAGISGNMGLEDALLAVQWVQNSVAAFGGDPKKVLVFGESAGAGLAWILSTLPQAPNLMSAALGESGVGRAIATNSSYQLLGQKFAKTLNCSATDISCFRGSSIGALLKAMPVSSGISLVPSDHFSPFLDGIIIPGDPTRVPSKVPILAGTNSQEGTLFTAAQFKSPTNVTSDDYSAFLQYNFGALSSEIGQVYTLAEFNSTGFPAFAAISQIFSDAGFKCPARRFLNLTSNAGIPAFTYFDAHATTCGWESILTPQILQVLGATHSSELPLVFRQLTNLPPPNGTCNLNSREAAISAVLTTAWTSMAAKGNPGSSGITGGPWPVFNGSTGLGLLITNSTSIGPISYTVCDLWDKVALAQSANVTSSSTLPSTTASSSGSAASPTMSYVSTSECQPSIALVSPSVLVAFALTVMAGLYVG